MSIKELINRRNELQEKVRSLKKDIHFIEYELIEKAIKENKLDCLKVNYNALNYHTNNNH